MVPLIIITGNLLIGFASGSNLDSPLTAAFLDTFAKTLHANQKTGCDVPAFNQTKPYFFGITDLKCLQVDVRLRDKGYDVNDLRQKFPKLIGKRSVSTEVNETVHQRSPQRSTLRPVHRWIFYDGYFVEFGTGSGNIENHQVLPPTNLTLYSALNGADKRKIEHKSKEADLSNANMQTLYPKNGDICEAQMESEVAGYSSVPLDCIYKCARSYVSKYGKYHLLKNNCHLFANRISKILCTGKCPDWCK